MKRNTADTFSTSEAAQIAGVPYSRVDYWARTRLVVPSIANAKGTGSDRRYSSYDLLALRAVAELRANGSSTQSLRSVVRYLRAKGWPNPLADCHLVKVGNEVCFVRDKDLMGTLKAPGQGVFTFMLNLQKLEQYVTARISELRAAA
jgi:DNA-binding transcriptional MerR regulator